MADDKKGSEETLRTPDPAKSPQLRYWDDDGNWKAPLSGVASTRSSEEITSGASPTNCVPNVDITYVTSGGTAGDEHVVLPNFDEEILDSGSAPSKNGKTHVIVLSTRTGGSDVLKVFPGIDGAFASMRDDSGLDLARIDGGIVLDAAGGSATFVWCEQQWFLTRRYGSDSSELTDQVSYVPALDPNPATESAFFGVAVDDTEPSFKPGSLVPALDPNPADANGYFGFNIAGSSFEQKSFRLGFGGQVIEITSGTPEIDAVGAVSSRAIRVVSDGLGHENTLSLAQPGAYDPGSQLLVTAVFGDPADTISINIGGSFKSLDGSDIDTIVFTATEQWVLLEVKEPSAWTVLRGTAVIDPPIGVKVTNGVPVTASNIVDFSATFGAISALTGTLETVNIPGLLTTDHVTVSCIDSPPSGMIIANARVSAADTLELYIVTAVALGITLGALNFRCLVHR